MIRYVHSRKQNEKEEKLEREGHEEEKKITETKTKQTCS